MKKEKIELKVEGIETKDIVKINGEDFIKVSTIHNRRKKIADKLMIYIDDFDYKRATHEDIEMLLNVAHTLTKFI